MTDRKRPEDPTDRRRGAETPSESPIGGDTPSRETPGQTRIRRTRTGAGTTRGVAPAAHRGMSTLAGQVLIAMPGMDDPRFDQSVIYLCAHTPDGAMGIVVNRPLAAPTFGDLLTQLKVSPVPPARSIHLCAGGPVDNSRGFVLHTTDWTAEGSLSVDGAVALTASLDILKAIAQGGGPKESLLALGYAGWGAGQLDGELQRNVWLTAPAKLDVLFDGDHETKWRRALATLRIDPALLSTTAGHA